MTDLPTAAIPPSPATRPSAIAPSRAAPARNGTPQPSASPFQDALALELGLGMDGTLPPVPGAAAAAAKAGSSLKPGEDTAQSALAPDMPLGLALLGLPALPSASAPPAVTGEAPLSPAYAATGSVRAALASGPRPDPLAQDLAAPGTAAELPAAATAADPAVRGKIPRFAAGEMAQAAATRKSEQQSPIATTADLAVPGKFAPPAEGEIRRELAFNASLLEQHMTVPAATIHSAGPATAAAAPAPVAAIEARVGERGWDQGLGDKLVWMASQKHQVAELHLNPPDLGPLKITLTLDHDQASAQFVSAHASVREAIEAAMPRLREMLADGGITLGNTSVSTDSFREQAQHEPRAYQAPSAAPAAADSGAGTRGEHRLRRAHGLVDTFA